MKLAAMLSLVPALLLLAACAPKRPVLYPNQAVNQVGWPRADRDIDECVEFASSYGYEPNPAQRTAASTAGGSAIGAATGAAWGGIWRGRPGPGAAAGAAAGAAGGFLRGLFRWREPEPLQRRFIEYCLRNQGYAVIGWK